VLGTLWRVPDDASATVVAEFYRQMALGREPARALAEAQRAAIRMTATRHPYFWAGYALSGTGDG